MMKLHFSCWLAGVALCVNTAFAGGIPGTNMPQNSSAYAGGSVGLSQHDGACNALPETSSCDDSATGYKVFAGVRLDPIEKYVQTPALSAEVGYINFGENTADGATGRVGIYNAKASSEVSGVYAAGVAYVPVAPQAELLGKAGVMFWNQEGKVDVPDDPSVNSSASNNGAGLLLGGGAQFKLNENFSIRGEVEHVFGTAKDTTYDSDATLYSIGAVFSTL